MVFFPFYAQGFRQQSAFDAVPYRLYDWRTDLHVNWMPEDDTTAYQTTRPKETCGCKYVTVRGERQ